MELPGRGMTNREYEQLIATKDARRAAIAETMTQVNDALAKEGRTTGAEIVPGWKDVNGFFPYGTSPGNRILHVRLSPVLDDGMIKLSIRELDREKMLEDRKLTSTGDEHQALVRIIKEPTLIPDAASSIIELVRAELPLPQNTT